jgi:hypothetical protein
MNEQSLKSNFGNLKFYVRQLWKETNNPQFNLAKEWRDTTNALALKAALQNVSTEKWKSYTEYGIRTRLHSLFRTRRRKAMAQAKVEEQPTEKEKEAEAAKQALKLREKQLQTRVTQRIFVLFIHIFHQYVVPFNRNFRNAKRFFPSSSSSGRSHLLVFPQRAMRIIGEPGVNADSCKLSSPSSAGPRSRSWVAAVQVKR